MPWRRHRSATGAPASCSFKMPIIFSSLCRLLRMTSVSSCRRTLHQTGGSFGGKVTTHRGIFGAHNGGMEASDAKRLKALEAENQKLKKLLAEQVMDNATLKELLTKNFWIVRHLEGAREVRLKAPRPTG